MPTLDEISPFHSGELEVQRRIGVDQQVADVGRRMIRDHLLQQHQDFYRTQHQLLLALVDEDAQPWVAMVAAAPGFASALTPTRLRVDALPVAGPPTRSSDARLRVGEQVGVLGIDYSNRRRNRVNGRIVSVDSDGFEMQVVQSFGNCPKYIQIRETQLPAEATWRAQPTPGAAVPALSHDTRALITQADHFYVATHYDRLGDEVHHGADVSHRGGKPGFVRINDKGSLVFPDLPGNRLFNTLGNIASNGKAALLFIDFNSASLLSMTGTAQVDWRNASEHGFAQAERLVRFTPTEAWMYTHALPLAWRFKEQSPALEATGSWP
ncbi:MAG: putative pyridoxine 5'-phosphate oxidase superfamily flavin-nucleotide-binding protein [Gammaproteobacteria bacterium]|jgi:predicted pyridoxine 5'-phosphate oxidase superfamily flavin-nucleotide-binding protein